MTEAKQSLIDNPAAFPRNAVAPTCTQTQHGMTLTPFIPAQDGMTLRDYLAGQAIIAVVSAEPSKGEVKDEEDFKQRTKALAITAYAIADAMLEVRPK